MTLRTAARLGIAGSAMPFAGIVAWFVVGAVVGQPIANMSFHPDPLALALPYLAPAAVFGFLVMLYRVSAGLTQPPRLGDAALMASVLAMVALAVNLRWTAIPNSFSGPKPDAAVWLYWTHWLAARILAPVAWLVFLLTFVRWPAPPLARASRRAAGWLALVIPVTEIWPVLSSIQTLAFFWWDFPPRGSQIYYAWIGVVSGFFEALRWILLSLFALGVWRSRPAAEPPASA